MNPCSLSLANSKKTAAGERKKMSYFNNLSGDKANPANTMSLTAFLYIDGIEVFHKERGES